MYNVMYNIPMPAMFKPEFIKYVYNWRFYSGGLMVYKDFLYREELS